MCHRGYDTAELMLIIDSCPWNFILLSVLSILSFAQSACKWYKTFSCRVIADPAQSSLRCVCMLSSARDAHGRWSYSYLGWFLSQLML